MRQKLYWNGTILTMETPACAQALLEQDGKIVAVGALDEVRQAAGTHFECVDLQGHTLMPSFIDAHSHFMGYAMSLLQVSVEGAHTFSDIQKRIAEFIENRHLPDNQWVIVKGYDHNALDEQTHPTREILDEASSGHPIVLQHRSGHNGVFNTAALNFLGVTRSSMAPAGGKIEKDEAGEPTGYMEENAFLSYLKQIPMPQSEEILNALKQAQKRYASYGITTVQDGYLMKEMVGLYQMLCTSHALELDVVAYAGVEDYGSIATQMVKHVDQYSDHLKIGGYKIFLDGSPQSRTAWMRTAYVGQEENFGYPSMMDKDVLNAVRRAMREGRQILAHCNGDAAAQQYLQAVARAMGELDDAPDIRPVMIHAQLVGTDQLPLMREFGVLPSFFIAHVYHWGEVHVQNLGDLRASKISPAQTAMRLELPFTFHQDAPVIEPDMMETVWCAVNRKTKTGRILGEEERIDTLAALKAITIHGAYQYFEENRKGSLKPGKLADMVILSQNPLDVPAEALKNIEVLETIKEGRTIYQKRAAE